MLKLSIVIPVYNVADYIEKCLQTCLKQDLPLTEYEIIVVNDGSKDKSLEIVEKFAEVYFNIRIISQENAGLSAARNRGLELATGEYIWFIDSDDWIEINCLKYIYRNVKGNDVLAMGMKRTYDNDEKEEVLRYHHKRCILGRTFLKENFFQQVPLYVFNRQFLVANNLKFYEGIFYEDAEFTPRMLYKAKDLVVLSETFYNAYKRPGSITTTVNSKNGFDCIKVAKSLSSFSETVLDEFKPTFNNLISLIINNALFLGGKLDRKERKDFNSHLFEERSLFRHLSNATVKKYKIEGFLFRIWPKKSIRIYNYLQLFNMRRHN